MGGESKAEGEEEEAKRKEVDLRIAVIDENGHRSERNHESSAEAQTTIHSAPQGVSYAERSRAKQKSVGDEEGKALEEEVLVGSVEERRVQKERIGFVWESRCDLARERGESDGLRMERTDYPLAQEGVEESSENGVVEKAVRLRVERAWRVPLADWEVGGDLDPVAVELPVSLSEFRGVVEVGVGVEGKESLDRQCKSEE